MLQWMPTPTQRTVCSMPILPSSAVEDPTEPQVFRQTQALLLGITTIVLGLALVLLSLRSISGLDVRDFAWPVAIALSGWALFVRPRVVVSEDAVLLDNLVRAAEIPWERIEGTQARWNLRVLTSDGSAYGSWAISKQRPQRTGMRSMGGFGFGGGELGLRSAWRNARDAEIDTAAYRDPAERPKSAGAVALLIDERQARIAQGAPSGTAPQVAMRPAWAGIAALGAAVVLVLFTILV